LIIVTGSSKGIGNFLARELHARGETVLGIARSQSKEEFDSVQVDVSKFDELKDLVTQIKKEGKQISCLINTAGVASMNLALLTKSSVVETIIRTNLIGTIYSCQVFSPIMIRGGSGSIINFSTIAVPLSLAGESIYAASKAGVETFSKVLARELAPFNINVNCIAPGPIETDLIRGIPADKIAKVVKRQINEKQFSKNDILDLVDILLSPKSYSITGQILNVGGV
jgi:3-oxoacyl-[acyl-carrier protein] reductase